MMNALDLSEILSQVYLSLRENFPQFNIRHLKRASEALRLLSHVSPKQALVEVLNYGFTQIEERQRVIGLILNHPLVQTQFPDLRKEDFETLPKKTSISAIPENINELVSFIAQFALEQELKDDLFLLSRMLSQWNKLIVIPAMGIAFQVLPSETLREIIIDELGNMLIDQDWHVRQTATQTLGEIYTWYITHGEMEYLKKLENLRYKNDWHIQITAAHILASIYTLLIKQGQDVYLTKLKDMMDNGNPEVSVIAINTLTQVYLDFIQKGLTPNLDDIEKAITQDDLSLQIAAINALSRIYASLIEKGKRPDFKKLEALFEIKYGRIKEALAHGLAMVYLALIETGQRPDFTKLESMIYEEDWRVRITAVNALTKIYIRLIQKEEVPNIDKLLLLFKDRYGPVTKTAATAVGQICAQLIAQGKRECLNKLEGLIDSSDWFFSRKVNISLAAIYSFLIQKGEKRYLNLLENMLNDKDFYVCIVAISSLARVYIKFIEQGEKPQLDCLENMLNHPNTYVRIVAASSLADVYSSFALRGEGEYLERLEDLLGSENRDLMKASANSLVNVYSILIERKQREYLNRLEALLENEDPDVSLAASKALAKIMINRFEKKKTNLQLAINVFERVLKEKLNSALAGSFSSEIKIDSNLVKIDHLELKRNRVLEIPTCVFTKSSFNILKTIALSYKLKHPVLLLGPTSTGKSFLIKWLATLLGYEHLSYTLNPYSSKFELIGGMKPDKKGRFVWQDGIILKAAKEGKWLVLEEINLASSDIIEVLNDYLTTGKFTYSQNGQQKQLVPAPNFALFATANPESYSQRQKLSKVFLSRWKIYYQKEVAELEMAEILSGLFKIPSSIALMIARFHKTLEKQAQAKVIGKEEKDPYIYSLRDIIRVGKRISVLLKSNLSDKEFFKQLFWELYTVYLARIRNESERQALISSLDAHFGFKMKGLKLEEIIDGQREKIVFLLDEIKVTRGDEFIPQTEADIIPTSSQKFILATILNAIKYNEPVLLVGMPASGKTTLIRYLAKKKQTNLFYISLSSDTGLEELLGGYVQDKKGRWYYRKGMLFKAVEEGFWLLVDEANLSPLSEYLNTLIDFGYVIDEEGVVYKAHPYFRLFLAINPPRIHHSRNLLSPSLRSRFFEIWVEEITRERELRYLVNQWMSSDVDKDTL